MSITEYIHSKEELKLMPFMSVYGTIMTLIKDGFVKDDMFDKSVKTDV